MRKELNLIKEFVQDLEMNKLDADQQAILFVGGDDAGLDAINSKDCTGSRNKECTNTLKCDHSSNEKCSNTGSCMMANNGCGMNETNCVINTQDCNKNTACSLMPGFPGFDI